MVNLYVNIEYNQDFKIKHNWHLKYPFAKVSTYESETSVIVFLGDVYVLVISSKKKH